MALFLITATQWLGDGTDRVDEMLHGGQYVRPPFALSPLTRFRRELPLGRKFELVYQLLESCLIPYSVVGREYHCRSQERVAFSQSGLEPV